MPWDSTTLSGYLLLSLIQVVEVVVLAMIFVSVLIMNVGLCLIVIASVADLEENLLQLNEMIEAKIITAQERIDVTRKLSNIIRFHAEAKE